MKIETLPLILGVIVGLLGLALLLDARLPDSAPRRERRRRVRLERSRTGEALIGLGVLAMAAAIMGRDSWRYSTLAILVGAGLLLLGTWQNRHYLRELVVNRGAARRRDSPASGTPAPGAPAAAEDPEHRRRIR